MTESQRERCSVRVRERCLFPSPHLWLVFSAIQPLEEIRVLVSTAVSASLRPVAAAAVHFVLEVFEIESQILAVPLLLVNYLLRQPVSE